MKDVNPAYRDQLFKVINESAFPDHLEMTITDIAWGSSEFEMTPADFRMQPFGVIHGGNYATLIDSATFWACYIALEDDADGLTSVDLKLNYLAPAAKQKIKCKGKMLKAGRSLLYAEAHVYDEDGKLLAHGTSTLMRLVGKGLNLGPTMTL